VAPLEFPTLLGAIWFTAAFVDAGATSASTRRRAQVSDRDDSRQRVDGFAGLEVPGFHHAVEKCQDARLGDNL